MLESIVKPKNIKKRTGFHRLINFSLSDCRVALYRFYNHKHSDCCLNLNFLHFSILYLAMEQFTIAQPITIVKIFDQNGSPHLA